jgi:anti-anti-sigma regulatory factor
MAFELQIANRRDKPARSLSNRETSGPFVPTTRIEIVGELNERSGRLAAERIDAELEERTTSVIISLDRVSRTQWAALCRLVGKIQSVRARGCDVRIVRPKPSIRLLLGTIALGGDTLSIDSDVAQIGRSIIIA